MNKSVYSLVLMDEVVEQIDRAAYEMNTSRSNMVNQILAEYVSYVTPEKRMREVFSRIERMLVGGSAFQRLMQPSESMFSLRSALSYKYNPTIRYSVELYRNPRPWLGELRVSLRSQNSALTLAMLQFFKLWTQAERSQIGETDYAVESTRYTRRLRLPEADMDNDALGRAIAGYIELFDRALKTYFENLHSPALAVRSVERLYAGYLRGGAPVL
ncbi:MAG: hypothetical protein Q4C13_00750 [Clostridia bacterium]|nr:hypothetical protein [Clostridia bacterium]